MNKIFNNYRNFIVFTHDLFAIIFAWISAYLLRFNFYIPSEHLDFMIGNIWLVILVHLVFYMYFKIFLASWRFSSLGDLIKISLVIFIPGLCLALFFIVSIGLIGIPRSVLILNPILLFLLMGGSRLLYRAFNENFFQNNNQHKNAKKNVVVLGSGLEAISLVKNLKLNPEMNIIGLFGNDKTLSGREISGIKIFGHIDNLPNIHKKKQY